MSKWLVSGSGLGGPDSLPPGDYRFIAVITETDDTTPWVSGPTSSRARECST